MARSTQYRIVQLKPTGQDGAFIIEERVPYLWFFWWGWSMAGDYDWTGEWDYLEFRTFDAAEKYLTESIFRSATPLMVDFLNKLTK